MRSFLLGLSVTLVLSLDCLASVRGSDKPNSSEVRLGTEVIQTYKVGVIVTTPGGACRRLFASVPVPIDWPEQEVRVIEEEISVAVKKVRYRTLFGTVRQMLIEIPVLAADQEAHALVTLEIKRRTILPPEDTESLVIPDKVSRQLKPLLSPSPYIESRHPAIRSLAKEIALDEPSAWGITEAIYDHVRENVEYRHGDLKGALRALRDGNGDCEELTSLFIALCRARGIPARTIWVPGHCYPEFYLVNERGEGHWFPCQVAGTRAFGEMPDVRPILQKGDNYRVPEKPKDRQRYVAEFFRCVPVRGEPKVEFVRELLN